MEKVILAGAVIIKNEKILLLHRKYKKWYELPGGKLEENENPEHTVVREIREELSLDIKIVRKLGQMNFSQDGKDFLYIWYLVQILEKPIIVIPDLEIETHDHFKWINVTKLNAYPLSPNMRNLVNSKLLD